MNILSLFDGISCGQIALNRAGIKYDKYFASEIDKHAIKVTQTNYPNTIQLGDVTKIYSKDLPKIDILIGGSPCQGFSFCGKQLNFNDPRSKLFFEYSRLLKECNPKYFLLENVRMKKIHQDVISKELGVQPITINSSLVSAQNRVRLYWTNIPNIATPSDKKILLKDIIQQEYDGTWVFPRGYNAGGVQNYNGKSPSITTSNWEHNFFIYKGVAERVRFDKLANKNKCVFEERKDEKSNALLTTGTKSLLCKKSTVDKYIRKFTPEECEKLQTVPVGYTSSVSNHQRYRCLGNGWTVDVISHILSFIPCNGKN